MHLGSKIKEVYEAGNINLTDFAKRIGTVRQNVYRIFERDSVDVDMLQKISDVLDFDFFQYYGRAANQPSSTAASTDLLQKEINVLTEQLEEVKKELEYQFKIVSLRQEEMRLLESKLNTQKALSDAIINSLKERQQSFVKRIRELEQKAD
ncbi:helix-turn-helix domain-containing protein [Mucilaginibacter sp. HMF5004]|uniref:helix-turn-helix domain-containing protein n=1 Tax=Mucilaginibacter rivuli TaxID=2857527 RepID=UPI001C5F1AFB|nr:helix-turn-helix transcriptional regulator [Mucilaginibacter rivuli]MBW4888738.1 helix-turn-helix domain-containing protein [Mucilaginibacter rivuli]